MKPIEIEEPLDRRGLFLMRDAPRLLGPGRLDAAATTLFLIETTNFKVWSAARKNILAGNCQIDAKLVSDLYRACPPRLKPLLASAYAVMYLAPKDFHAIFEDAYARQMPAVERRDLASALGVFLMRNPGERPRYRALIMELLRSREQEPCLLAISLAADFNDLDLENLRIIERKLSARYFPHRMQALYAIYKLLRRYPAIDSKVLDFCASDRLIERIHKMRREDPHSDVRVYARQTLKAYDKLPQARRRRE